MNQFFTFMIDWSLKSAVTTAFGFVFVLLLRHRSAATRHMVWRITLAAVVLLPLAMVLTPKAGAPAVLEPIQAPVRSVIRQLEPLRPERAFKSANVAAIVSRAESEGTFEEQAVCFIYGLGFIAMLGAWATSYRRVRRIANAASRSDSSSSSYPVLSARTAELRVPVTFGLFRPVILLPREAAAWPEQRVQAAILHETAHISRKDWGWQTASHLVRSLQWFNPAVWLIHGALQATSETATDDEVLTQFSMGPSTYASELLNVAEAARANVYVATAMARKGGVAGRLRRIVATGIDRAHPQRGFVLGTAAVFSAAGVLVAAGTVAEAAGVQVAGQTARLLARNPIGASLMSAVGATPGGRASSGYQTKLSHGGIVRIVALTGPQDGDGPAWRPDGTTATGADKKLLEHILARHDGNSDGRIVNFYIQVAKLPMAKGESENGIFRIKSSNGWQYQSGSNTLETDGRLQWDRWIAPASARTCDLDCAISYGSYTPVGQGTLGDGQFHSQTGDSRGDSTTVTFYLPGKFSGDEAQLQCYDASGDLVDGSKEAMWGNDDAKGQRFDFYYRTEDLKRIVKYRFSRRAYEHVLIRGIKLPPYTPLP